VLDLERHIAKLLLDNDCVIIPNFGGFVTHSVDAFFDEEDSLFFPPSRTVGFNQQLRLNDSMLAQSYVEAMDISYPDALTLIEKDVASIKERIETDGFYEFHDIGTLHCASDNTYRFEPNEAGILTPSLYGLGTFSISAIAVKAAESESVSMNKAVEKAITADDEAAVNEATDEEEEKKFSISYSSLRYLAAACLLGVFFLLFPTSIGDSPTAQLQKSKLDTNVIWNILPKDVKQQTDKAVSSQQQAVAADTEQPKLAAEVAQQEADTVAKTPKTYYTIVLASLVSKKNAKNFVAYLHENGYAEAKALPMGRYAKVVYKQFETEGEAYRQLNKINDNAEFSDAWVSKIKL